MGRNELCVKVCLDGSELEEMKPLYDELHHLLLYYQRRAESSQYILDHHGVKTTNELYHPAYSRKSYQITC